MRAIDTNILVHKRYSVFAALDAAGQTSKPVRVKHDADRLQQYFAQMPRGTLVAFESTGHWHWFADLLEEVGLQPKLTVCPSYDVRPRLNGSSSCPATSLRPSDARAQQCARVLPNPVKEYDLPSGRLRVSLCPPSTTRNGTPEAAVVCCGALAVLHFAQSGSPHRVEVAR